MPPKPTSPSLPSHLSEDALVSDSRAKQNVARTAHLTAWVRALGRRTAGDAANADFLADRCLLPLQRGFTRVPRLGRWMLERLLPGSFGYFNARTQYFDEVLRAEADAGLAQLVLLGAGFDSRPFRFAESLRGVKVFEVDMPQVLALRAERFTSVPIITTMPTAVPIDFEHDDLASTLASRGYSASGRTLFLWEGVTYYLPAEAVRSVLSMVARSSGTGSGILFDYVTRAFLDGDTSAYGSAQLAHSWRRLGNVNRSGFDDVAALVRECGLGLRSDLDAETLDRRYLSSLSGTPLRSWGAMRIAFAGRD